MADMKGRILVVDDEKLQREIIILTLKKEGHELAEAAGVREALSLMDKLEFDLILTDIMMTAHGSIKTAVEAIQKGAFNYLEKPIEGDQLILAVSKALQHIGLVRENRVLRKRLEAIQSIPYIHGEHPKMKEVFRIISKIAASSSSVLVVGESGTGKELVARAIHDGSHRKDKPFMAINCAAIPETLIESELFGHEKGSFTGANAREIGIFEAANGGTVFLDEIGEMNVAMQAKLLRAIQEKEIRRVGGKLNIPLDLRILAATNRELEQEIKRGAFRED